MGIGREVGIVEGVWVCLIERRPLRNYLLERIFAGKLVGLNGSVYGKDVGGSGE